MRVAQVTRFGGPEVIEAAELPDPVPGPGEVVIRVAAADTIFVETQIRAGWNADMWGVVPPYVPGGAVVGVVAAIGAGVDPSWTDRAVAAHIRSGGSYAEQALAPADALIALPEGLDAETAAALMHDGPTALGLFGNAEVRAGQSVLILPAAGGASSLLVQLAKAAGAHVTGAARGERKLDAVRELGADVVVDYAEPGWLDGLRADVIFEGVGGELGASVLPAAADGAAVVSYGAPSGGFSVHDPAELERRGIRLSGIEQVQFAPDVLKEITARALTEAAAGRIRPLIAQRLPLESAAEAHAAIESRSVVGKILLVP
ncbi:zinc-binding dehydrogenase [Streptomyces hainanensis]|uniref:NADPH:quinone reductase n=1 Tax=Streptomyces hainanensis TaxID=402648 RepID=A0A4R4TML1_9ACTN|nr:zinc-binding dehydrogenase [Streptomyces hainanensis]TDC77074.1 NADPH:quinone reductase [Streptomyces hainanensis]